MPYVSSPACAAHGVHTRRATSNFVDIHSSSVLSRYLAFACPPSSLELPQALQAGDEGVAFNPTELITVFFSVFKCSEVSMDSFLFRHSGATMMLKQPGNQLRYCVIPLRGAGTNLGAQIDSIRPHRCRHVLILLSLALSVSFPCST